MQAVHLGVGRFVVAFALLMQPAQAAAQNLLANPGFEMGATAGSTPGWSPTEAGVVPTSTAAHGGSWGAWIYTVSTSLRSFTTLAQDVPATPGHRYEDSAWIRTAPVPGAGGTWVAGAEIFVHVEFLDAARQQSLALFGSAHMTGAGAPFQMAQVQTDPAPAGTAYVGLRFWLDKPAGASGQAMANVDDLSLSLIAAGPLLSVSSRALGFGDTLQTLDLNVTNEAAGSLIWSVTSNV